MPRDLVPLDRKTHEPIACGAASDHVHRRAIVCSQRPFVGPLPDEVMPCPPNQLCVVNQFVCSSTVGLGVIRLLTQRWEARTTSHTRYPAPGRVRTLHVDGAAQCRPCGHSPPVCQRRRGHGLRPQLDRHHRNVAGYIESAVDRHRRWLGAPSGGAGGISASRCLKCHRAMSKRVWERVQNVLGNL